jgi:hypothetical protein
MPDGLDKVAADKGLGRGTPGHHASGSPFAGYGTKGVGNGRLSVAVAGVVGVLLTFGVGAGLFYAVRRREPSSAPDPGARDDQPSRTG